MASSQQETRFHARSISLPTGSHPSTLRFTQELNKLKTWETTACLQKAETILFGLSGLAELYHCVQDLLQTPVAQQAQHEKWVDEVLDGSIRILGMCETTRNILLQMKESARDVQMALRRRGESTIESITGNYMSYKKNAKKEVEKCLKELKRIETKLIGPSPSLDLDHNISAVVCALRDAHYITISVFQSMLSFISVSSKTKSSKWFLVSKGLNKGRVACEAEHGRTNEVESVDAALKALCGCNLNKVAKVERVQTAQKKLKALEDSIESLEQGLESLLKCLIQTRVALLNNLCQ